MAYETLVDITSYLLNETINFVICTVNFKTRVQSKINYQKVVELMK